MVAINFQPWKAEKVERGESNQTIRRNTKAYTGCQLQLYTGQRTKKCRLLRKAKCLGTESVAMDANGVITSTIGAIWKTEELDAFARADGFKDYGEMWDWFYKKYRDEMDGHVFYGWRIWWEPLNV